MTGTYDMLARGGPKILPVVPQLIIPMKVGFNTKEPRGLGKQKGDETETLEKDLTSGTSTTLCA